MLRDNLAGLIEPMIDRAGAHPPSGHPKQGPPGGCYSSTEVAIVALKRSWRQIFPWKTRRQAENGKRPGLEGTTAAHDSRTVRTAQHQSHRTIDPQCLKKSPPRRGGIYALTENVALHFTLNQDRTGILILPIHCLFLSLFTNFVPIYWRFSAILDSQRSWLLLTFAGGFLIQGSSYVL